MFDLIAAKFDLVLLFALVIVFGVVSIWHPAVLDFEKELVGGFLTLVVRESLPKRNQDKQP